MLAPQANNLRKEEAKAMNDGNAFLTALDLKAKTFAPAARATIEANDELCSWLLNPLARWAGAAYGDRAFEDAAKGYARYCMGVWKCQQQYEKTGRYTPETMPELVSEVYEDEGYMVPYMWAAILHLSVLALDDQPYRHVSRRFY